MPVGALGLRLSVPARPLNADPKKNRWLVNAVTHRAFDPVSGQVDFKHVKARIEKI